MTPKNAKAAPLDLTDFLASARFPHSASIPLGNGQTLAVTYRAADPARARAAILAAAGPALTGLGFDPEVVLAAAGGRAPKEAEGKAFQEAFAALDAESFAGFQEALKLAEGAAIASVLGSWGFGDAITAETCASLPADLKKTVQELANAAVLPVDKLDFLGQ